MEFRDRYQYNTKTDFIAKGGFSRVYKAYDRKLNMTVALKVYSTATAGKYDLINEIRRIIPLSHPNICKYFDGEILNTVSALGEEEILQIGVMEYLDGGTIKQYVNAHPEHLNKLLTDVLQGLAYLHQNKIIHRDLNPPNILISHTGQGPLAKISDFNICKVISETAPLSTQILGKVEYMAPEQFAPETYGINKAISCNLDLWSFGCVTYELLKGEPLFGSANQQVSTHQIVRNILTGIPSEKLNKLEEPYKSVVSRCIVKDARQRAQSAEELIKLLRNPSRRVQEKKNGLFQFLLYTLIIPVVILAFMILINKRKTGNDESFGGTTNNQYYNDQSTITADSTSLSNYDNYDSSGN